MGRIKNPLLQFTPRRFGDFVIQREASYHSDDIFLRLNARLVRIKVTVGYRLIIPTRVFHRGYPGHPIILFLLISCGHVHLITKATAFE